MDILDAVVQVIRSVEIPAHVRGYKDADVFEKYWKGFLSRAQKHIMSLRFICFVHSADRETKQNATRMFNHTVVFFTDVTHDALRMHSSGVLADVRGFIFNRTARDKRIHKSAALNM